MIAKFGEWIVTLADLKLLKLELNSLAKNYRILFHKEKIYIKSASENIYNIASADTIDYKPTIYSVFVDIFKNTNAYAFHNLYPYKGKFYPRLVRTLINAFNLNKNSTLFDPFNGSGTTTHEASLMGIRSVGYDVSPLATIIAQTKNDLLFVNQTLLEITDDELKNIFSKIENKIWNHENKTIHNLMLIIYFDVIDATIKTTKYNKLGRENLFIKKFNYIKDCYTKLFQVKKMCNLNFAQAKIDTKNIFEITPDEQYDACITSPPYYFSIDYIQKDDIAYDYLQIDKKELNEKYLGKKKYLDNNNKISIYFEDLKKSIHKIYCMLKQNAYFAIIVGDSSYQGEKIQTTKNTIQFCKQIGFRLIDTILNPLIGNNNRAIRSETIIICKK